MQESEDEEQMRMYSEECLELSNYCISLPTTWRNWNYEEYLVNFCSQEPGWGGLVTKFLREDG